MEAEHELLQSSANVASEPKNATHREKSAAAADRATQAINGLMKVLQAEVNLLSDLDDSIRNIRAAMPLLDSPADGDHNYGKKKKKNHRFDYHRVDRLNFFFRRC